MNSISECVLLFMIFSARLAKLHEVLNHDGQAPQEFGGLQHSVTPSEMQCPDQYEEKSKDAGEENQNQGSVLSPSVHESHSVCPT
jgi:hypothetical protein